MEKTIKITEYTEHNGLYFIEGTAEGVKRVLSNAYQLKTRIRIHLGDVKNGRVWLEEYDVIGRIGRSTGKIKVPLMLARSNSHGGGAILTDCILAIQSVESFRWLYKAENFQLPELSIETPANMPEGYTYSVIRDGKETQANFKSRLKAQNYIDFMRGKRMRVA